MAKCLGWECPQQNVHKMRSRPLQIHDLTAHVRERGGWVGGVRGREGREIPCKGYRPGQCPQDVKNKEKETKKNLLINNKNCWVCKKCKNWVQVQEKVIQCHILPDRLRWLKLGKGGQRSQRHQTFLHPGNQKFNLKNEEEDRRKCKQSS